MLSESDMSDNISAAVAKAEAVLQLFFLPQQSFYSNRSRVRI